MAEFSRSLAIVIGINQYGNGISLLKTAVNDAKAVARILEQEHKYDKVWLLLNEQASLERLQQILEQELSEQVQPNDRLLFYFAGHGIALNGEDGPEGFLIPQDAKLGDTKSYLPMSKLQASLSQLPCRHFLGILDCCFAGAFRWSSTRKLVLVEQGIIHKERYDRFVADPAWQVITSAAYDQTALDSLTLDTERGQIGNHSPFAAALIEALSAGKADLYPPADATRNKPAGDGVTTATELYTYLRDRIEPETEGIRHRQTPGIWSLKKHDKGEYIFLTPGHVLNLPPAPPLDESKNPYRGLRSFEEEQSDLFFGRQSLTARLCEFVNNQPLSVVLGASGSGKSSLVKAGLIPDLKQNTQAQPQWQILASMRPGESPFRALGNLLVQNTVPGFSVPEAGSAPEVEMLTQYMATWNRKHPGMKLLLVIDQFEELITLCRDEKEREQFQDGLARAVTAYPKQLRLVLTLRSDFEPQFQDGLLKQYWKVARFIVPPMTRAELREAIEEPASKRVMYFQSDDSKNPLVDQLIDEVAEMPGALPLLSFTLSELYLKYLRRQEIAKNRGESLDRAITEADYKDLGGVARSLTQRADQEYEKLVGQDLEYAKTIQNIMLRMVAVGGELARRRVPLSEFAYPPAQNDRVKEVIQRFSVARLLVEGQDPDGKPYVEPAHDALVRGWQKLLTWKQDHEESLTLQRRLTPAAEEWKNATTREQPKDFLVKVEPVIDRLDRGFYRVESLLNQASVQVARLWKRSQQKQEYLREKPGQFLWNTNPYLDVLNQQLQSNHSWFNQLESEFVQESVLQRRQNTSWRWRIATGVILGLSALSIAALIGQRSAQIGQTTASRSSAEANFRVNEQLNALIDSLRAGKNIEQIFLPDNHLRNQVGQTLRNMVYGAKEISRWNAPPGIVFSLFFTSDRQLHVITNDNGKVRLCNIRLCNKRDQQPGQQPVELQGQEGLYIGGISVSPDGSKIATATKDGTVRLWDLQGKKLDEFATSQGDSVQVSFSPDSTQIATFSSQNNSVLLWDLQGNNINSFSVQNIMGIVGLGFKPNGELLIASLVSRNSKKSVYDYRIKVTDSSGQKLATSDNTDTATVSVNFSPSGETVAIKYGEGSESAMLLDLNSGQSKKIDGRVANVAFSTDGKQAVLRVDGNVEVSTANRNIKFKLPQGRVEKSTFSPDGSQLITLGDDNTIRFWDLDQQPLPKTALSQRGIKSISFSSDAQTIAIVDSEGIVRLLDSQGNQTKQLTGLPIATSVSLSPDGQTIATTEDRGMVRLSNLQGNQISEFQAHSSEVSSVSWSQDGQTIATIGDGGVNDPDSPDKTLNDSLVRLWNTKGELLKEKKQEIFTDTFRGVSFQSNGEPQLLSFVSDGDAGSAFSNVNLLDFSSDRSTNVIPGRQAGNVFDSVKISSDGSFILTASGKTVSLWSLRGERLMEFTSDKGDIESVSLSPDNSMLAVTSKDATTELWQLGGFDQLIQQGCDRVRDYLQNNPNVSDRQLCDR